VATRTDEDRVLTIPNALSLGRLLCAPVFVWLLFGTPRPHRLAAAVLLGVLGATDCVDGYVARHLHQVSKLGKVLDPVADRVLLAVGVVSILVDGAVPLWLGLAVIGREALVSVAVLVLAGLRARRIDVSLVGKAGTFCLMTAFPLFLLTHDTALSGPAPGWHGPVRTVAWLVGLAGLVLGWYALATYVPAARLALAEGRAKPGAGDGPPSGPPADPQARHEVKQ